MTSRCSLWFSACKRFFCEETKTCQFLYLLFNNLSGKKVKPVSEHCRHIIFYLIWFFTTEKAWTRMEIIIWQYVIRIFPHHIHANIQQPSPTLRRATTGAQQWSALWQPLIFVAIATSSLTNYPTTTIELLYGRSKLIFSLWTEDFQAQNDANAISITNKTISNV